MFLLRNAKSCQRTFITSCVILTLLLFFSISPANEKVPKRVLILHSYHPSLSWTASVMKGRQEVLPASGVPVQVHVAGSEVTRTPSSFYAINKIYVWTGIVSLLVFSGIIVLLGINILARKKSGGSSPAVSG